MDNSPGERKSPSAWFALGFLATICQVLLLRDYLVFCTGSELGIAVLLCTWLAGIAAGAWISGPSQQWSLFPKAMLPLCLTLLALSCPASLILIRLAGLVTGTPAGGLVPFGWLAGTALAAALPPGLLVGIAFPLACAEEAKEPQTGCRRPVGGATTIGRIYALEAAGSVSAGLIHTWLLVALLPAMRTALLSAAALSLAAARHSRGRSVLGRRTASAAGLLLLTAGLLPALGGRLDRLTLQHHWHWLHPGIELLQTLETPYQRLEAGRLGEQIVFVANGTVLSTYPDPWAAALWGHLVLSAHPSPRRVLLAGGLQSGLLPAMLTHPRLEEIRFVEQDPALPALFRQYASGEDLAALADPRFALTTGDGRRLINRMAAGRPGRSVGEWDLIVILLPDPTTALINRYYTREFYAACRRLLRPGGILLCRVTASANYLEGEAGALARSVRCTLAEVFPMVRAAGGDQLVLAASTRPAGPDFFTADQLVGHYGESGAEDPEFSPQAFHSVVEAERSGYLEAQLAAEPGGNAEVNSDWHPWAQLQTLRLWSRFSGDSLDPVFRLIFRPIPSWLAAAAVTLPLIWALAPLAARRRRRVEGFHRKSVLAAVTAAGFAGLGLELICIYIYQGAFGNLYRMIGSLVALFMLGLAIGAAGAVPLGRRLFGRGRAARFRRVLVLALGGQALIALCAPAALGLFLSGIPLFSGGIVSEGLVLLLVGAAGWFTGLALPSAAGMLIGEGPAAGPSRIGNASALVNNADHLGAMAAAALIGLAAIPRLGLPATAALLALITACCAMRLAVEGGDASSAASSPDPGKRAAAPAAFPVL